MVHGKTDDFIRHWVTDITSVVIKANSKDYSKALLEEKTSI